MTNCRLSDDSSLHRLVRICCVRADKTWHLNLSVMWTIGWDWELDTDALLYLLICLKFFNWT